MPVLSIESLTKHYGGTVALDGVSLEVRAGEIHALVGENGSGKSTLCKILLGDPVIEETGGYAGRVALDGESVHFGSVAEALARGIALVHQEPSLVERMSVAENVTLGAEPTRGTGPMPPVDDAASAVRATEALARLGVSMDVSAMVTELSIGTKQLVEAAREFGRASVKALVLDEPSAALSRGESESLCCAMRTAADEGVAVLFVSHRLAEVLETADRVSVLRDGRLVATMPTAQTSAAELARLMLGSDGEVVGRRHSSARGERVLTLRDLSVAMPGDRLRALSLEVRVGEIVGVTSQAGHGRLALANGLLGLYPARGELTVAGASVAVGDAMAMEQAGLSVVHEDRRGVGLEPDESIELNIVLPSLVAGRAFTCMPWLPGGGFLDRRAMRAAAEELAERFDIRCISVEQNVGSLSGGNQQKVAIARGVASRPRALIVAEPTRGIDIGAKEAILAALGSIAEQGVGVVIVSGEVAELERVCDRIVVLRDGSIAEQFTPPCDVLEIELAVLGERRAGGGAS
jgi:simple sugar transport system ATP-binding protein